MLDDLLSAISDSSVRVNNLFQRDDGTWQANVREGEECFEFGVGATPYEAMSKALAAAGYNVMEE